MKATHILPELSDEKSVYIVLDPSVAIEDSAVVNSVIESVYANVGGTENIKVDGGLVIKTDLALSLSVSDLEKIVKTISDTVSGRHDEIRAVLDSVSQSLRLPILSDEKDEENGG